MEKWPKVLPNAKKPFGYSSGPLRRGIAVRLCPLTNEARSAPAGTNLFGPVYGASDPAAASLALRPRNKGEESQFGTIASGGVSWGCFAEGDKGDRPLF